MSSSRVFDIPEFFDCNYDKNKKIEFFPSCCSGIESGQINTRAKKTPHKLPRCIYNTITPPSQVKLSEPVKVLIKLGFIAHKISKNRLYI